MNYDLSIPFEYDKEKERFVEGKPFDIEKFRNKLSYCIRTAIEDLKWVLSRPKEYTLEMDYWHTKEIKMVLSGLVNPCKVCLAGSVMTRAIDKDTSALMFNFPMEAHCLKALDSLRLFDIKAVWYKFYIDINDEASLQKAYEVERDVQYLVCDKYNQLLPCTIKWDEICRYSQFNNHSSFIFLLTSIAESFESLGY
jgi:hypothetical protein